MLTLAQKTLVQETFATVATIADDAAALFYRRLFEIDPSLQQMFRGNMAEQRKKLMQMLTAAVKGLDHPDQLIPAVQGLGRRHAIYGVTDKHYETVGAALLWTLQKALGNAFTPEAREAWTTVYGLLATTMKDAAREGLDARNRIVASALSRNDVAVVNPWIASRILSATLLH
jgi:hemoglobin-like flavoprotein